MSMRRIATEIGVTPAALYRYVLRKDELFELMIDAVFGEQDPPPPSGEWRTGLRVVAYRARQAALQHPWLAMVSAHRPALGPHSLRWMEYTFGAFDGYALDADDILTNIGTMTAFVTGHVINELAEQQAGRRSGLDHDQWMAAQGAYGHAIITGGKYPRVARIMIEANGPHARDRADRSFALGLERILDGLATTITRQSAT